MPKLYSSAHVVSVLQTHGYTYVSQRGSHVKFRRTKGKIKRTVIIPANRKEIPIGTFRSILRQSGLEEHNFAK